MWKADIPYEAILFVCTHARAPGERVSCAGEGFDGQRIFEELKKLVKEKKLEGRIRVSKSGCMDRCEEGPVVLVVPRQGPPQCCAQVSLDEAPRLHPLLIQ